MGIGRTYWVYILASDIGGTLHIGVSNDLVRRVYQHRTNAISGFSQRCAVHRLVYYEQFDQIEFAIQREKRLKKWNRAWKIALIERQILIGSIFILGSPVHRRYLQLRFPVVTGSPGQAGR